MFALIIQHFVYSLKLFSKVINVYVIKISDAMMNFDSLNQNM